MEIPVIEELRYFSIEIFSEIDEIRGAISSEIANFCCPNDDYENICQRKRKSRED